MAREGMPDGFAETVGPHVHDCLGIIVASTGDCEDIRDKEIETISDTGNRTFEAYRPDQLPEPASLRSWLLGVLLCPSDGTEEVAAWASDLNVEDLDRIRFYYLPGVDLVEALQAWYAEGLADPRTADVEDWGSFHHEFGWDHSSQLYQDIGRYPQWFT